MSDEKRTGPAWGGIEGIVAGAREELSAHTRRVAENVIYGAAGGWSVEIVRLPLPSAPIGEHGAIGATYSPPQLFPTVNAALAYARGLVQRGYHLRLTGPQGEDWDQRTILARLDGRDAK